MSTTISDFIDVRDKLDKLDLNDINKLTLLPFNFESAEKKEDLIYDNSVKTIRTLFRNNSIPDERIERQGEVIPYRQLNHVEWLYPTIFVTASLLTENSGLIDLSLGVISNYLTDFFKGVSGQKTVKVDIIVEKENKKKRTYKKVSYEGDKDGLKELGEIIKNLK